MAPTLQAVRTDCIGPALSRSLVPRVSQDQLDARRQEILAGARACFARHGYEGATVRRLEEETGLSRGAIFHHFRDKESLFLAVPRTTRPRWRSPSPATAWCRSCETCSEEPDATGSDVAGWLGTQLEVSRRLRTDPEFASAGPAGPTAITAATRERLARQREAGVLRDDVPVAHWQRFLELAYDGLVLAPSRWAGRPTTSAGARPGRGGGTQTPVKTRIGYEPARRPGGRVDRMDLGLRDRVYVITGGSRGLGPGIRSERSPPRVQV